VNAHRRQRGQVVWLMALCAIPIALGIGYLFNSAELLSRKVRAQNAADAAALSQATWMARSMNVMATNNVAFTQTEAILVASSAVMLTATDLTEYQGQEGITQGIRAGSTCTAIVTAVACVDALYKLIQLYLSARALENIVALATAAGDLADHARAFAQSNDQLAQNFARFSADMQRSLAQTNGLTDPPRIVPVIWNPGQSDLEPDVVRADRLSTGLPVARIDWGNSLDLPPDLLAKFWKLLRPTNGMGYDGQHRVLFGNAGKNFLEHGYNDQNNNPSEDSDEVGPWAMARNDVKDALEKSVDHAKNANWSSRWSEEDPDYDTCWDTASMVPAIPEAFGVPIPCIRGGLSGPDWVYLYGPAAPENGHMDESGITDVLVLAKSSRARNFVAPKRFTNTLPAAYGIAKSRLYSASLAVDLYSSDWHATLVPLLSWKDEGRLPPNFRTALDRLLTDQSDTALANYMKRFSDQELYVVLSH
jgi:hypothetical protein